MVVRVVVLYQGSTCSILSYGEGNFSAMLFTFCGFHVLRLMKEEHLPKGSSTDGLDKLKVINSGHLEEKERALSLNIVSMITQLQLPGIILSRFY